MVCLFCCCCYIINYANVTMPLTRYTYQSSNTVHRGKWIIILFYILFENVQIKWLSPTSALKTYIPSTAPNVLLFDYSLSIVTQTLNTWFTSNVLISICTPNIDTAYRSLNNWACFEKNSKSTLSTMDQLQKINKTIMEQYNLGILAPILYSRCMEYKTIDQFGTFSVNLLVSFSFVVETRDLKQS